MRKLIFTFAFVLAFFTISFAQVIDKTEIVDRNIEWSDFVGKVDKSSNFDAYTYWVTTYSFPSARFENGRAYVTATVRIYLRSDSWVRPAKKSDRLLKHEQGHFIIGRICAKEIETTINSTAFNIENYHQEIDKIYWEITNKYRALNKQYDAETNHFKNQAEQERWDKKLIDLLNQ